MIAELSLLARRMLLLLDLSELRFLPFSGPHNGVRIRRGTPPSVVHKCKRGLPGI